MADPRELISQLMQLAGPILSSPKGAAMAQAVMQSMGGKPQPTVMGRGPATDAELEGMNDTRNQMRPDMPYQPGMDEDVGNSRFQQNQQGMSDEQQLDAVRQMMGNQPHGPGESEYNDNQGHGGINADGPTNDEIKLLMSNPSPRNQANFDKLFGPGAAQEVLGKNLGTAPGSGGSSYEDDVRGAMQGHRPGESDYDDEQGHND